MLSERGLDRTTDPSLLFRDDPSVLYLPNNKFGEELQREQQ